MKNLLPCRFHPLLLMLPIALGSIFYFDTFWIYVALAVWIAVDGLPAFAVNPLQKVSTASLLDYIPLLMVSTWMYGVLNGIMSGVEPFLIFRNYFGMVVYALYPTLRYYFRNRTVILNFVWRCAVLSGVVLTFMLLIPLFEFFLDASIVTQKIKAIDEVGVQSFRLHYAANSFFLLAGVVLAYSYKCERSAALGRASWKSWLVMFWFLLLYLASLSKGFILALVPFVLVLMLMRWIKIRHAVAAVILTIGVWGATANVSFMEVVPILIGDEASRDASVRQEQFTELISDFSLLGRGLGAGLSNSSYLRDPNFAYSFELTYINLLHKFGVFAVLVFASFALTIISGVGLLFSSRFDRKIAGAVSVTLMLYLIISIGNPIMFSPICVISHMLAIMLISRREQSAAPLRQNSHRLNRTKNLGAV